METLKIVKREIELDIYGDKYRLKYPSAKRMIEFGAEADKVVSGESELNEFELAADLLKDCGLKKSIIDSLYYEDLITIINALKGVKKN